MATLKTMMTPLTAMDIYSVDMAVPFDIAAYCRGHKYSLEAVALAKVLRNREAVRTELASIERKLLAWDKAVAIRINAVREKMNKE